MGEAFFLYIPQQIAQRNALFFIWYGNGKQYALLRNYRTDFFLIQAWLFCCNRAQRTLPTEM